MADFPPYAGLDPSIVNYLQGGDPSSQNINVLDTGGTGIPSTVSAPPPPPPPPPPPSPGGGIYMMNPRGTNMRFNAEDPAQQYYGLPATVAASVQNGFAPLPDMTHAGTSGPDGGPGGRPAVPEGAPPIAENPIVPAAPEVKQPTPQELAAKAKYDASPEGIAQRAEAEQRGAINEARVANADASTAEQAQNTAKATAIQASMDRQAEEAKAYAARQAQQQADVAKYTTQYAQQIKDAANYKVDTDRHISNAGLIAIALSGIGDALDHRHGPNAAMEIISNGIDKRIADQWAQKKALGETAEQTKGVLDVYRKNADDDRQAQQFQRAAERDKMADDLQLTAANTTNPAVKARAEAKAAQLTQESAAITMAEAQRKAAAIAAEQAQKNKEAEIGVHYASLAQAKDQFNKEYALKVAQLQAAGQTDAAKQAQAEQEAVNNRGMFVPGGLQKDANGNIATDGKGNAAVAYKPIVNQDNKPWVAPEKAAEDLGKQQAATIDGVKAFDAMRAARKRFSTAEQFENWAIGTEEGRALVQQEARAIFDVHEAKGITRFSGEVVDLAKKTISGGPDADSTRAILKELDNGRGILLEGLDSSMRGRGKYTGAPIETYFPDPLKQKGATPDAIEKAVRGATNMYGQEGHEALVRSVPTLGLKIPEEVQRAIGGRGAASANDLANNQTALGNIERSKQIDQLNNAWVKAGPADRERIIEGLNTIEQTSHSETTRQDAANARRYLLENEAAKHKRAAADPWSGVK